MMKTDIEKMAREYRQALESSEASGVPSVEQIITLEENQLDCLNALLPRVSLPARRTINYIKNIVFRLLQKLNLLLHNDAYVPSFRNVNIQGTYLVNALLNTQISIFALYDKLPLPYNDLAEILSLENRKTSFLSLL